MGAAALLAVACERPERGSGEPGSEVRKVGGFSAIEIDGAVNAEISTGTELSVEVSGDANLVPLVTTEVEDERLRVGVRKSVRPELDLVVRIVAPEIERISVSRAARVAVRNIRDEKLALSLSGAAEVTASGATGHLDLEVSGAGSVDAGELEADAARVAVSGAGNVTVHATRSLDVAISGAGSVAYRGDPTKVRESISGAGRLEKLATHTR